jgi:hypothetical protein
MSSNKLFFIGFLTGFATCLIFTKFPPSDYGSFITVNRNIPFSLDINNRKVISREDIKNIIQNI